MTERIERQIARFAPGFCERVLVRRATSTAELESINANLIGGAITGGANDLWQMVARPTLSAVPYRTPIKGIFLCSSSTPPGGGVHGMCGFHAANAALRFCKDIQEALISYSKVGCLKKYLECIAPDGVADDLISLHPIESSRKGAGVLRAG